MLLLLLLPASDPLTCRPSSCAGMCSAPCNVRTTPCRLLAADPPVYCTGRISIPRESTHSATLCVSGIRGQDCADYDVINRILGLDSSMQQ